MKESRQNNAIERIPVGKKNNYNILNLDHSNAKEFFLAEERYFTFDLPKYFTFTDVLRNLSDTLDGKNLSDFFIKGTNPKYVEHTNYKLFNNKNGEFSWRVFQLIHPAIYVSLVHEITKEENWNIILNKFKEFQSCKDITCSSLPTVKSNKQKTEKGEQILTWWEEVEQKSIILSLDYSYIFHTDIVDCYGSIYTHSIPWALHTKEKAKNNRSSNSLIGNFIDTTLQYMSYGQTNGIPQGSILMDFIAEMILGYADLELSKKIRDINEDYKVIRYRDDYRIFVNNPEAGRKIIKELTDILASIGMRINSEKTHFSDNVIDSSIKKDKLFWLMNKAKEWDVTKNLLIIKSLSEKFPNSGTLIKELQNFYKKIYKISNTRNPDVSISIITDIAYKNPRSYPISVSIIGKFISLVDEDKNKKKIIEKIEKKLRKLPNTEVLSLWLQRLTLKFDPDKKYQGKLSEKIYNEEQEIWESSWLNKDIRKIVNQSIVNKEYIQSMDEYPNKEEILLFGEKTQYQN